MRTSAQFQALYQWVTIQEAAKRLGGVGSAHVLELGRQKLIRVTDLRLPGAKRGVYRVDPESVQRFIDARELGPDSGEAAA